MLLTTKTSAATFRSIAKELGITLKGDARYKDTKKRWIVQINDVRDWMSQPSKLDIMVGIVAYRYSDKTINLTDYLLNKFKCGKICLDDQISNMMYRDGYLHFDKKGDLEHTLDGALFMAKTWKEQQIYVCVVDDEIIDVLSYDEYVSPSKGGHHTLFTKHEQYKVFVSLSNANGLSIHSSVSNRPLSEERIFDIVKTSQNIKIQNALKFWKRYHRIMENSLISLK